jgi:hypothetical protein
MRHFYDFNTAGKDVEWFEVLTNSGTVVLSSGGGGTGALRLGSGDTDDSVSQIYGPLGWAMYDEDRVVDFAARIQITNTEDNKHAVMCGIGYNFESNVWETGGYIDYSGKELGIFLKKADDENWWCVTSSNLGGEYTETRSNLGAGSQYNSNVGGAETLRVMMYKERGDITRVRFYHDPKGFGAFQPVLDEHNKPVIHIRDESAGLTSQKTGLSLQNTSAANQRVWVDWWSVNATRGPIVSTPPDPWPT